MRADGSTLDRPIIVIATVALLLSVFFMLNDRLFFASSINKIDAAPIGTVLRSMRDVRRKTRDDLAWFSLGRKELVYESDTISTGGNGVGLVHKLFPAQGKPSEVVTGLSPDVTHGPQHCSDGSRIDLIDRAGKKEPIIEHEKHAQEQRNSCDHDDRSIQSRSVCSHVLKFSTKS